MSKVIKEIWIKEQYLPPKRQVAEKQKYQCKITQCCKKYPEVSNGHPYKKYLSLRVSDINVLKTCKSKLQAT